MSLVPQLRRCESIPSSLWLLGERKWSLVSMGVLCGPGYLAQELFNDLCMVDLSVHASEHCHR